MEKPKKLVTAVGRRFIAKEPYYGVFEVFSQLDGDFEWTVQGPYLKTVVNSLGQFSHNGKLQQLLKCKEPRLKTEVTIGHQYKDEDGVLWHIIRKCAASSELLAVEVNALIGRGRRDWAFSSDGVSYKDGPNLVEEVPIC